MSSLDHIKAMLSGKTPGRKSGGGDIRWYRFPEGKEEVKVRFLPAWEGAEFFIRVIKRHYNLPDTEKSVICPTTYGLECPVCEVIQSFENSGVDEVLNKYAAATLGYANVLVRKDPTQNGIHAKKPYIATLSEGLVKWVVQSIESDVDFMAVVDPYEGRDLVVNREKFKGKFAVRTAFSSSPIGETQEEVEGILSEIYNLDKQFKQPADDDINNLKKIATTLKDTIENRVLTGGDANQGVEDHVPGEETTPTMPKTAAKPAAAKPAQTTAASKQVTLSKPAPTSSAPNPLPKSPVAKPKVQPAVAKPAPKPVVASEVAAPEGAPECFANAEVYQEGSEQCDSCEYEFNCKKAIQG